MRRLFICACRCRQDTGSPGGREYHNERQPRPDGALEHGIAALKERRDHKGVESDNDEGHRHRPHQGFKAGDHRRMKRGAKKRDDRRGDQVNCSF